MKQVRLRMGWSQSDLARRLKTDLQTILNLENGAQTPSNEIKSQFLFLLQQADFISEQTQCGAIAEQFLEAENIHQIFHPELRDKFIIE